MTDEMLIQILSGIKEECGKYSVCFGCKFFVENEDGIGICQIKELCREITKHNPSDLKIDKIKRLIEL